MTPEQEIQDRFHAVRAIYENARGRSNCPWDLLDRKVQALSILVSRTINADWANRAPAKKQAEYTRTLVELDNAADEFTRWRDMPAQELANASVKATMPPEAPPAQPAERARILLDSLHQRGIRLEVGSKGRISARPARLLTDQDKQSLIALKAFVAALWKERNDVWVVE
ncbi:hypothetical protein Gbfr_007_270 [Gluconobacter frateurii M-2]|uniref:Uncharacterized protein n=2 Tax=Gluconobacter japonicus TaxID=376620 RepID=A0ABQ5WFC5_GLUJA|nr:hypothetical protein Gbfr_007_270 [Gluconobacter frateurii M-2]GBR23384.1 hypothetical protein AA3271_1503 [Gluconobacter japonicus NBRC 3271]GLQ58850.1 hypothetical protein GCM10010937_06530 [Gluconobacter japonicus]